jgi:hypothetical protein
VYRFTGKHLDNPPKDLLVAPLDSAATAFAEQQVTGTGIDLSVVLGKFSPSLRIGKGTKID